MSGYGDDIGMFGDFFRYWDELPQDGGFRLFGWIHIGWLVGIIFVCIVTGYYYRKADAAVQDRILKILTGICLCLELGKDLYLILIGEMGISYLPFEMCGLAIFVELGFAFFHREFLGEIMCVISMPGAMAALLFPDWTRYPLFNYMHINTFLIHGLLVLVPVLVLTSGRYRPSIKRIWQIFLFLFMVVPSVYVINRIWDCNFMFLCYPSNGSPFLSVYLQHGYVPYLIIYAVTVILCILVIYGILDKIASFCSKNVVYINRKN